ncbi:hypothetical protein HDU77_000402, partial [Chytriomyces hyalinus]
AFGGMTNLKIMSLAENKIQDTAASNRMGNPNLSYTTVSGPIPESISQPVSMHALNSSHNLFTGKAFKTERRVPITPIFNCNVTDSDFGSFWVSLHNCFCGAIPESIARSGVIYFLILRHNLPAGKFPSHRV